MLKAIAFTILFLLLWSRSSALRFPFALCLLVFGELGRLSALIGMVAPRRALARSLSDMFLAIGCLKEASSQTMA
jgi:hypothetical protein